MVNYINKIFKKENAQPREEKDFLIMNFKKEATEYKLSITNKFKTIKKVYFILLDKDNVISLDGKLNAEENYVADNPKDSFKIVELVDNNYLYTKTFEDKVLTLQCTKYRIHR